MIIDLKELRDIDINLVGSKSYQLYLLHQKGYTICDGYVLTSKFFKYFCTSNELDTANLKEINIMDGKFDSVCYKELENVFREISKRSGAVIVRSSGTEEDKKEKSFAGIYESIINITSIEAMLEAIKRVWCSYLSNASKHYLEREIIYFPVLIQEMIFCDKSGVAFTKNPVNGEDEIIIETCFGNNQGIIDNKETATRYIISNNKKYKKGTRILTKNELNSLIHLSKDMVRDFCFPCDFEWGIKNSKIIIFQLRPITMTAKSEIYTTLETSSLDCILLDRYANPACVCYLSLLETWQNNVYLSLYNKKQGNTFDEKPLCFFNNRVYWNIKYQRKYFDNTDQHSISKKVKLKMLANNGYKNWYRRIKQYDINVYIYNKKLESTSEYSELIEILDLVIHNFCSLLGVDHFRFLGLSQILYKKLESKLADTDIQNVMRLIGKKTNKNKTVIANNELMDLINIILKNKNLYKLFSQNSESKIIEVLHVESDYQYFYREFLEFISRHGHRGIDCDDLYYPHWNENYENLVLLIKQLITNKIVANEGIEENITIKNRKLKKLVQLTGEYMCLRENQRYYFDKSWVLIRKILLILSEYYVAKGVIQEKQNIFHMTINEIRDGILYKNYSIESKVINERYKIYEAAKLETPPYVIKDSQILSVQKKSISKNYKVMGISKGKALGKVRIIMELKDLSYIEKNEIAVVKTFHPSWTPILKIVSGLIMNYGNILSHGAVVAREYNIPVVVFNEDATNILKNGDIVEINGTIGRIKVLERRKRSET